MQEASYMQSHRSQLSVAGVRERLLELEISQEEKEKSIELISKLRQKEKEEAQKTLQELEKKHDFELRKARKDFEVKMDK